MEKISKNYVTDGVVESFEELLELAEERKSVAYCVGIRRHWFIRPAAFIVNWPLAKIKGFTFYKTKKVGDKNDD